MPPIRFLDTLSLATGCIFDSQPGAGSGPGAGL